MEPSETEWPTWQQACQLRLGDPGANCRGAQRKKRQCRHGHSVLGDNRFVYELGRALGAVTPQTRFVELFVSLDDEPDADLVEYRGVYVLTEAVGPELEGLGILPPDSVDKDPEESGYLLEITQRSRVEKDEPSKASTTASTLPSAS
jgi:hypothetical protein